MPRIVFTIISLVVAITSVTAFSTAFLGSSRIVTRRLASSTSMSMRVVDIDSEAALDKTVSSAGSALVVVDYSTTWCGPCKGGLFRHTVGTFFLCGLLVSCVDRISRLLWRAVYKRP
jgi:thiol:disulfide interchange protein